MIRFEEVDLKSHISKFNITGYTLHYGDMDMIKLPLTVLSIDPGTKNMGVRIDRISKNNSLCLYEKIVELKDLDTGSFTWSILQYLVNELIDLIPLCNLILIERQLAMNKNMIVVENILCSMLTSMLYMGREVLDNNIFDKVKNQNCCIISVNPKLKSVFYQKNITNKKKHSYEIATEIIMTRYCEGSKKKWREYKLKNSEKKLTAKQRSDIGDCVLQIYAFLFGIQVLDGIGSKKNLK